MKSKYSVLQKKYKLPSLKELEADFELYTIEHPDYILKDVAKKIADKIEFFAKVIEEQIQPETSLSAMHEIDNYNENEKKVIFDVYKRLIYHHRSFILLELDYQEKAYAEFINEFWKEWKELRKQIEKIVKKMRASWLNHKAGVSDLEYFG